MIRWLSRRGTPAARIDLDRGNRIMLELDVSGDIAKPLETVARITAMLWDLVVPKPLVDLRGVPPRENKAARWGLYIAACDDETDETGSTPGGAAASGGERIMRLLSALDLPKEWAWKSSIKVEATMDPDEFMCTGLLISL